MARLLDRSFLGTNSPASTAPLNVCFVYLEGMLLLVTQKSYPSSFLFTDFILDDMLSARCSHDYSKKYSFVLFWDGHIQPWLSSGPWVIVKVCWGDGGASIKFCFAERNKVTREKVVSGLLASCCKWPWFTGLWQPPWNQVRQKTFLFIEVGKPTSWRESGRESEKAPHSEEVNLDGQAPC